MAEDIEERNQRPKLELTGEHVHLVAFAIAYDREVRTDEIDFVLGRNFLLTAHPAAWDPWTAQHLRGGAGPLLERGADFLLWALLDALVDALQERPPSARQFHRSLADVNHTVAIWQSLYARFTEHTGLAAPSVAVLSTLMRKSKKQVAKYLASLHVQKD